MCGHEPLLPPSLEELELLLTVVPDESEDEVVGVVEPEPEFDVVSELDVDAGVVVVAPVPVVALWLAANAVTPNSAAAPATVEAIATRMRVVRDRTGGVMHQD